MTQADYTYDPQPAPQPFGDLVSQHRDAESAFYQFDALGSSRALTDDAQVVTDEAAYQAFGKTAAASGTTHNPFQWVGKVGYYADEETELYSPRRRQYAADQGRFVSEDPVGFSGGDPNLYRYASNNAAARTDPSGEQSLNELVQEWLSGLGTSPIHHSRVRDAAQSIRENQERVVTALAALGDAFRDIRPFFETDEQLEAERNASGGWMLHAGILSGLLDREEEIEKILGDPNSELNRRLDNLVAAYDAYFRSLVDANVVLEGYLSHQTFTSPSVRPSIEVIQRSPTRMGPLEATSAQYEELGRSGLRVSDAYERMDERAKRVEVVVAETQKWAERIELAVAVLTVAGGAYIAVKEAAKQGAKQAWRALGKYVFKTGATLAAGQVVISPLISTLQQKLGLSEESIRLGTLAFMIVGMHRSGRRRQHDKPSSTADESVDQARLRNEPQFDENVSQETSGRRQTQPFEQRRTTGTLMVRLIDVPQADLDRMVTRLKGLKFSGNRSAFDKIEAFGSRAGSTFRGRGVTPDSDLDLYVREAAYASNLIRLLTTLRLQLEFVSILRFTVTIIS